MKDTNFIPDLMKQLEQAACVIRVGVLGGGEVAEYATANEFGTKNIPERSFLRSAFDDKKNVDKCMKVAADLFREDANVSQVQEAIGATMQGAVRTNIASNIQPANAQSTIDRKGSSKTLIDTGRMLQSITYEVARA